MWALIIMLLSAAAVQAEVGGAKVCTGANYTGSCWHGSQPLNTCIDLNGYAYNTLSFLPDADTRCFLMQQRCNANVPYVDLVETDPECADLTNLPWIAKVKSYTCYEFDTTIANTTTIARLRRVRFIPHPV